MPHKENYDTIEWECAATVLFCAKIARRQNKHDCNICEKAWKDVWMTWMIFSSCLVHSGQWEHGAVRGERELIVTRTEKCEHFLSRVLNHGIIQRIEYNEAEEKNNWCYNYYGL